MAKRKKLILFAKQIKHKDLVLVGGKNANLGEMINRTRVPVPPFFSITAAAYRDFIKHNKLDRAIRAILRKTDTHNLAQLAASGKQIRQMIATAHVPSYMEKQILKAFDKLGANRVAVRSSATAEDLPRASFAGQQESYLNVSREQLIQKVKDCFASLFTDRAISYRVDQHFDHFKVWLSVGVQKMVHSKASGVVFTLDPDTGHQGFVVVNGSWGLGDYIVQGKVNPDQFYIHKDTMSVVSHNIADKKIREVRTAAGVKGEKVPAEMRRKAVLNDAELLQLTKYALAIEEHYGKPQDIEWAKDSDGTLYIVQSRPETVHTPGEHAVYKEYFLRQRSRVLGTGLAIGRKISSGKVNVIRNVKQIAKFKKGDVLVTHVTDPDWEPVMKFAAGIITEVGGRTSHAAIVSRELGVPAIVGVTEATKKFRNGQAITLDCTEETGKAWEGALKFEEKIHKISKIPKTKTKLYVNVGTPDIALDVSQLPVDGVGLARQEFILSSYIGEHPLYMIKEGRGKEFVLKLSEGIARIAAAFYPRPVVVRLSDFKTDEYRELKGGKAYEPVEANPMLGWRGASRYIDKVFEPAFRLECRALKRVREELKLTNVIVMVPFCRTVEEGKRVIEIMESEGLKRGRKGLKVYVMAEIPSNVLSAREFAKIFDGFSIGSNDLTQLTLGIDRNSERIAKSFDERNFAVLRLVSTLIADAHKSRRVAGICGEAPSNYPDFAAFLVKNRIDSISVEADAAVRTRFLIKKIERSR